MSSPLFRNPDIQKYRFGDWRQMLSDAVTSADALSSFFRIDQKSITSVTQTYPMRINPYYLSLIQEEGDPLWKQAVPDIREIQDRSGEKDPLYEEQLSPAPNLVHRYPDRVLFMVSSACALNCRFCLRKRIVGKRAAGTDDSLDAGIDYITRHKTIQEVILSGGDPLLLEDDVLNRLLQRLHQIPHVGIIRIHTRMPCALPHRITPDLAVILKQYHPLYLNAHFNHPAEITPESAKACRTLADAGIPLGSQTVLLKGVNDNSAVMRRLMTDLIKIRVKPYYIHHPDPVRGTAHFRPPVSGGLVIMKALRGHISGMCVPHYVIDLPGGGGKVPLLPDDVEKTEPGNIKVRNYKGDLFDYPVK
jgi:lysine 2,3-aminomutase